MPVAILIQDMMNQTDLGMHVHLRFGIFHHCYTAKTLVSLDLVPWPVEEGTVPYDRPISRY